MSVRLNGYVMGGDLADVVDDDKVIFFDNFERPDQAGLGIAPTGQIWQLTGPGAGTAGISDGAYVVTANTYAYIPLNIIGQPHIVRGKFVLNTIGDVVVLFSSGDYPTVLLDKMIHLLIQQTSYHLTWWDQAAGQSNRLFAWTDATGAISLDLGIEYEVIMQIRGAYVYTQVPGQTATWYDPNIVGRSLTGGGIVIQNSSFSAFTAEWTEASASLI